jgi:hypothetical protein
VDGGPDDDCVESFDDRKRVLCSEGGSKLSPGIYAPRITAFMLADRPPGRALASQPAPGAALRPSGARPADLK